VWVVHGYRKLYGLERARGTQVRVPYQHVPKWAEGYVMSPGGSGKAAHLRGGVVRLMMRLQEVFAHGGWHHGSGHVLYYNRRRGTRPFVWRV
jgi:hypothetical protein